MSSGNFKWPQQLAQDELYVILNMIEYLLKISFQWHKIWEIPIWYERDMSEVGLLNKGKSIPDLRKEKIVF